MKEKDKRKLSIEEQIADLKEKNIKFDIYSEEEAKKFLRYNNYFFKLKSYAHNYDKYSKVELNHKYLNLDFAYLVELSTLDIKKLFFETMLRRKEYFLKNDVLVEDYKFVCQVIKYLENQRNNAVLKIG